MPGTPKRINFCPRPREPMVVEAIRLTSWKPKTAEDRALHRLVTERAHEAGDEGLILFVLWELNRTTTPAELDLFYRGLRPYVAHAPKYAALIDEIYAEMWHYFLGGLS